MMAMAGAERVFGLLDLKPEVHDVPDAQAAAAHRRGMCGLKTSTFGYNPDRPVLHDINFEAQPGQMIALVGPTGSGKSSIISLIARFYQPQQGRVLVDGHDIRHVTGDSLHKQMGLVLAGELSLHRHGDGKHPLRQARMRPSDEVIDAARAIGSYDSIMTPGTTASKPTSANAARTCRWASGN